MNRFDRRTIVRITYLAGVVGTTVIVLAMFITALGYRGTVGEPYSPLNHFVSELGEVAVSDLAPVFNLGLIVGGLCFVVFMLGVARFMGNWYGIPFAIVGVLMGVNGALVGIFPMDNLEPHIRVALNFFYLGLFSMALFSLFVILFRKRDLPLWLLLPGLLTAAAFFTFLFLTPDFDQATPDLLRQFAQNRPSVYVIAIIEWLVMVAILIWVLAVSLYLRAWVRRQSP